MVTVIPTNDMRLHSLKLLLHVASGYMVPVITTRGMRLDSPSYFYKWHDVRW